MHILLVSTLLFSAGLISPSTTTFAEEYLAWILGKCYTFSPDIEGNTVKRC